MQRISEQTDMQLISTMTRQQLRTTFSKDHEGATSRGIGYLLDSTCGTPCLENHVM